MKLSQNTTESFSLLKIHEWLAIAIVIGMIAGLACLTSFYSRTDLTPIVSENLFKSGFDVFVKGAVANPGVYHIHTEMKMKDLLELAGVSANADLRRFNLETMIKKSRVINVPERAMIRVHLKGALKADQTLIVPKGSKVEDLLQVADFASHANKNALKRKRRLKSEETIVVPSLDL